MGLLKKFFVIALLAASVCTAAEAGGRAKLGELPAPRLHSPDEEASVGPDGLEFRWSNEGDRSSTRYVDFRLYEGTQTYEKGQILAEKLDAGASSFRVKPEVFKLGGTYAWSVRAVGTQKGRSAYSIFKVVSKT